MISEERHVVEPVSNPEVVPLPNGEDHVKEKSVYKGVFRCGKKFKAQIQTNRVQHYLGLFDTEVEAARAYDNHARVVLGPKARTNFEYSNQVSSEQPVVLVAPLFTRQDGRSNFTEGASEQAVPTAPKRSYVGIKMKRKESARMGRLGEDGEPPAQPHSSFTPHYGHALGQFAQNGLSGPDPRVGAFGPKGLAGTMTEEQYRWFEQFQQMQQIQQHQQFLMQFGGTMPNPFGAYGANFMPSMPGMPSGGDPYSMPYMPLAAGAGAGSSQYGMFSYDAMMAQQLQNHAQFPGASGLFGPFPSQSPTQTPDLSPLMNMYSSRDVAPSSPRKHLAGSAVPPAGATAAASGASQSSSARPGRVRDMPRDQSTLAAAVQLGQLMGMSTQSMLNETTSSASSTGSAASPSAAAATAVAGPSAEAVPSATEGAPERAAVSPASSHSGSRHSSGSIDEDAQVLLDAATRGAHSSSVRSSAYQFTGQPLPNSSSDTAASRVNTIAPPESTPQEEPDEEEDLDWRDQLYYWTGILYFDPVRALQVWKGSWVGSYSGKPMPEEFSWSFNHFEYTLDGSRSPPTQSPEGILLPQSGPMQGYYLMDNDGSGALQRYVDTEYTVEFDALPNLVGGGVSELYAVYGRGDSDFGEFVVTGSYNKRTRILEMTRQYIAENDPRSHMSIAQLKTVMRHQR